VLDAEVYQTSVETYQPTEQLYGNDMLLFAQKQYWNNMKTTQCICDAGYTGYDCSTRMCPKGDDPSSGCTTELKYSDVQIVSLSLTSDLDAAKPFDVEQYFTLKYTDSFNNEYETKPLSYYDDASTVQKALMALPNFVIPNAEVVKIFPEDTLLHKTTGAEAIQDRCSTFYHETFQDVTCHSDLEFSHKFGLPTLGAYNDDNTISETKVDTFTDIKNDHTSQPDFTQGDSGFLGAIAATQVAGKGQSAVFCDMSASYEASTADGRSTHGMCIETQENCAFRDGVEEFKAGGNALLFNQPQVGACGDSFEPDGIYMTLMREARRGLNGEDVTDITKSSVTVFHKTNNANENLSTEDIGNFPGVDLSTYSKGWAYWGRRLSSFERSCHIGKFESSRVSYAVACTDDSHCTRCGGWTNVKAGICDITSGICTFDNSVARAAGTAPDLEGGFPFNKFGYNSAAADASICGTAPDCGAGHVGGLAGVTVDYGVGVAAPAIVQKNGAQTKESGPYSLMSAGNIVAFNAVCKSTAFIIKFSDNANSGSNNLLEVSTGDKDTYAAGASPLYRSEGVSTNGVFHAGLPNLADGNTGIIDKGTPSNSVQISNTLNIDLGSVASPGANPTYGLQPAASCIVPPAAGFNARCFDGDRINAFAAAQNVVLRSLEGNQEDAPKLVKPGKGVYSTEELKVLENNPSYDEVLQCSNQGACGYSTGLCTCANGFTGDNCGTAVAFF